MRKKQEGGKSKVWQKLFLVRGSLGYGQPQVTVLVVNSNKMLVTFDLDKPSTDGCGTVVLYKWDWMGLKLGMDIRVFRKSLFVELDPGPKICDANRYRELT